MANASLFTDLFQHQGKHNTLIAFKLLTAGRSTEPFTLGYQSGSKPDYLRSEPATWSSHWAATSVSRDQPTRKRNHSARATSEPARTGHPTGRGLTPRPNGRSYRSASNRRENLGRVSLSHLKGLLQAHIGSATLAPTPEEQHPDNNTPASPTSARL